MTDQPLDWANEPAMSPVDAVMWRGDADPRLRGTISMLEIWDTTADWDRLVAAHEWASRMAPRFRQRVVESPFRTGTPTWAVDPDFDLSYHLRRMAVGGDGSYRELLQICAQLAMTPLDPSRPPWEGYLFEGLPDGRTAYLLKAHHAMTDGVGAILGLAQLHSTQREPSPAKPQPPVPPAEGVTGVDVVARQFVEELRRLPRQVDAVSRAARSLVHPREALRTSLRYGRSLPRVTGLASPPGSPLLARRGAAWRFAAFDVPFGDLRAAAKEARGSFNDAYLAGLVGGFRIYHEALDHPIETMPIAIPISVRQPGDSTGGNRIAVGRLAGPVAIEDPFERVLTIREQVRLARHEPAVDVFNTLGPMLAWLPAGLLLQFSGTTAVNDLQASNFPGIPFDTYVAGAKVERMYPFGPLPGCAVMAGMITHGPTACMGLNFDSAAVTDPELFAESIAAGFAEVLSLAPGTGAMTRVL